MPSDQLAALLDCTNRIRNAERHVNDALAYIAPIITRSTDYARMYRRLTLLQADLIGLEAAIPTNHQDN